MSDDKPLIDVLHAARGGDSDPELMLFDLPDFFGAANPQVAKSPRATGKLAMDLSCTSFSKVFVIWRPWETCPRCQKDLSTEKVTLPEEGDYTCPHVQEKEYKEIKDMCLKGEAVLQKEEFFNMRSNDSRCVHILWWRLDDRSLSRLRQRKEGAVWPPNPEAVFAKGKKPKKTPANREDETVSITVPEKIPTE